jgi:Flp pilus assembly pilin Flp
VKHLIHLFRRDARGISSVEYAMLAVGVAVAILAGVNFLGVSIKSDLTATGNAITGNL